MREYIFRGKRKDNGEWVEGSLVTKVDPLLETNYCFILAQGRGESFVTWHMVDPSTVGQFTGLMDKNGKRIFEGDIVRKASVPMLVIFGTESAQFFVQYRVGGEGQVYENTLHGHNQLEVIGNIHDNPELLEGGGADG